jgi:hypothetical protein
LVEKLILTNTSKCNDCYLLYVVGRMFSSVEKSRFLMSSLNKPVSSTTLEHYILYWVV